MTLATSTPVLIALVAIGWTAFAVLAILILGGATGARRRREVLDRDPVQPAFGERPLRSWERDR